MANNSTEGSLFQSIKTLIEEASKQIVRNVNTTMVFTYFQIGKMIVDERQGGEQRAAYAKEIITSLSEQLTAEYGKGYSTSNLEYFRQFYLTYQASISQTVFGKSDLPQALDDFSKQFTLSWSHYIQLLKVKDEKERRFYEIEAYKNNWSLREMQRQINAALFERLSLSKDKEGVTKLAQQGQIVESPTDVLKSHYVLEFLDLKEDNRYSESDLETAIINKLEHFMLELGKGFLFEGRQRRFTFEGDSFYVDLVFYNRLLKCFVLLDLKIGKLSHQDIGQMQMYVNYYDRKIKTPDEHPTIGIVLCKEENKAVVEFTLPEDNKTIFAKEYQLYLPSKKDLKKQLK
ncbi:MAG: PDDEXK nuclease domain-containing protein [Segetibacter sp.]